MRKTLLISFFILTKLGFALAQEGTLTGTITDNSNNEALIGATVAVKGTSKGASTDLDGHFEIKLAPGTYSLAISYIGYQNLAVTDLIIKEGQEEKLALRMLPESEGKQLEVITVTAVASRQSVSSLFTLQQKSASIVSGISSEDIKKSPDRNTADVLKRVSGTSIQDNKFVIIRGLADRYNCTTLNGMPLPSTEPDRRAFSFDIFPSNLLDNLIVYKTANADISGEFAGGVIQLNTKEIPEKPFLNLNFGAGYNSISTFNSYSGYKGSGTDFLGMDNGYRAIPSAVAKYTVSEFKQILNGNDPMKYDLIRSFKNDWAIENYSSMSPSYNLQLTGGRKWNKLGLVAALTYSRSNKTVEIERGDFNIDALNSALFHYTDKQYRQNTSLGGMLSLGYNINETNRIQINNVFNANGDNTTLIRTGTHYDRGNDVHANSMQWTGTRLYNLQVLGEHANSTGIKAKWGASYSNIYREVPNFRRMYYYTNNPHLGLYADTVLLAQVPPSGANPDYAGRFFSDQNENLYTGNFEITLPYTLFASGNAIRFGGFTEYKDRAFHARLLGYNYPSQSEAYLNQSQDTIFAPNHIGNGLFTMAENTNPDDSYEANSMTLGGYLLFEQNFTSKLKAIVGLRVENIHQQLDIVNDGVRNRIVDRTYLDFLPSLNLTYTLNEASKLRASFSRTVARPNFRELAPFSFYDFNNSFSFNGTDSLVRTQVTNADLRYEIYPGQNQMFAITAFYKYFNNPIEQIVNPSSGAGSRAFSYANIPSAQNYGIELEWRQHFGFLGEMGRQFTLFTNLALINSTADYSNVAIIKYNENLGIASKSLQGQSPYVANCGLTWNNPEKGISATILYNQIGRRIWQRGANGYRDIWENSRSVFDVQFAMQIAKKGEIKLTIGDLLNQRSIFYQDWDNNGRYEAGKDNLVQAFRYGTNVNLSFGYKF